MVDLISDSLQKSDFGNPTATSSAATSTLSHSPGKINLKKKSRQKSQQLRYANELIRIYHKNPSHNSSLYSILHRLFPNDQNNTTQKEEEEEENSKSLHKRQDSYFDIPRKRLTLNYLQALVDHLPQNNNNYYDDDNEDGIMGNPTQPQRRIVSCIRNYKTNEIILPEQMQSLCLSYHNKDQQNQYGTKNKTDKTMYHIMYKTLQNVVTTNRNSNVVGDENNKNDLISSYQGDLKFLFLNIPKRTINDLFEVTSNDISNWIRMTLIDFSDDDEDDEDVGFKYKNYYKEIQSRFILHRKEIVKIQSKMKQNENQMKLVPTQMDDFTHNLIKTKEGKSDNDMNVTENDTDENNNNGHNNNQEKKKNSKKMSMAMVERNRELEYEHLSQISEKLYKRKTSLINIVQNLRSELYEMIQICIRKQREDWEIEFMGPYKEYHEYLVMMRNDWNSHFLYVEQKQQQTDRESHNDEHNKKDPSMYAVNMSEISVRQIQDGYGLLHQTNSDTTTTTKLHYSPPDLLNPSSPSILLSSSSFSDTNDNGIEFLDIYHGMFQSGNRHGYGIWFSQDGIYSGPIQDNYPCTSPCSSIGNNKYENKNTEGRMQYCTGDYMEGDFQITMSKDHRRLYSTSNSSSSFQNPYLRGVPHGKNIKISFADGGFFNGSMNYGIIEGDGIYVNAFGELFQGYFRNGVLDSDSDKMGTIQTVNKEILHGSFQHGQLSRQQGRVGGSGCADNDTKCCYYKSPTFEHYGLFQYGIPYGKGRRQLQTTTTTTTKTTTKQKKMKNNEDMSVLIGKETSTFHGFFRHGHKIWHGKMNYHRSQSTSAQCSTNNHTINTHIFDNGDTDEGDNEKKYSNNNITKSNHIDKNVEQQGIWCGEEILKNDRIKESSNQAQKCPSSLLVQGMILMTDKKAYPSSSLSSSMNKARVEDHNEGNNNTFDSKFNKENDEIISTTKKSHHKTITSPTIIINRTQWNEKYKNIRSNIIEKKLNIFHKYKNKSINQIRLHHYNIAPAYNHNESKLNKPPNMYSYNNSENSHYSYRTITSQPSSVEEALKSPGLSTIVKPFPPLSSVVPSSSNNNEDNTTNNSIISRQHQRRQKRKSSKHTRIGVPPLDSFLRKEFQNLNEFQKIMERKKKELSTDSDGNDDNDHQQKNKEEYTSILGDKIKLNFEHMEQRWRLLHIMS